MACHLPPVGVGTPSAFNFSAALRADNSDSPSNTLRSPSARSRASQPRLLVFGEGASDLVASSRATGRRCPSDHRCRQARGPQEPCRAATGRGGAGAPAAPQAAADCFCRHFRSYGSVDLCSPSLTASPHWWVSHGRISIDRTDAAENGRPCSLRWPRCASSAATSRNDRCPPFGPGRSSPQRLHSSALPLSTVSGARWSRLRRCRRHQPRGGG